MAAGEELVLEPYDSPHHPMAAWFADIRRQRAKRRATAAPASRRSRAMITIVNNEPIFLPIWLAYYSRFFAAEDIYVLDNESTDDSTKGGGFVRIPASHDRVDHRWMVSAVEELQQELLGRYEIVVFTDVDELITPVPQHGTLGDYLDRFDEEWVNCLGYEILHLRDREPTLRLDRPILDQRNHWFYNDGYDKAAIATVPLSWNPGFHGRSDFKFNLDPDLRLIHLHRVDYQICLERHRARSHRRWADGDAKQGWAVHNLITEEAEFRRWFYEDSCVANLDINLEPIGPWWRGAF
jgi:hypothetical protein